jgi:hypothetical protein
MDAAEMVDIIHYYFEDDARYASGEQAEAIGKLRNQLYLLYGKTYRYGASGSAPGRSYMPKGASVDYGFNDDGLGVPSETKPYVPPTDFNPDSAMPFGSDLDAPLN